MCLTFRFFFILRGLAFWIERDGADGRPVSRMTRPAGGVAQARLEVDLVARGEDVFVLQGMPLGRRDIAQTAVTVLEVVPAYKVTPRHAPLQGRRSRMPGIRAGISRS